MSCGRVSDGESCMIFCERTSLVLMLGRGVALSDLEESAIVIAPESTGYMAAQSHDFGGSCEINKM